MSHLDWEAIVIGGGAAGLWGAGTAALRGRRVLVLEKNNKAGPKILMSGGTRCNVTHHCDSRRIAEAFGRNGRPLLSPLKRLTPQDVVREFERMGVPTKVEDTGKIFPVSDRAIDVRDALLRRIQEAGGVVKTGVAVKQISPRTEGKGFDVAFEGGSLTSENVLLTTGGLSYSGCGTTGDGYAWASSMGHRITPCRPALTPLVSSVPWVHALTGITLDDVLVTAFPFENSKNAHLNRTSPSAQSEKLDTKSFRNGSKGAFDLERSTSRGGLLWTHFGCSGPTAMNVSRVLSALEDHSTSHLIVDLLPVMHLEATEQWLLEAGKQGTKSLANVLSQLIPRRLADLLLERNLIPAEVRMAELSKVHRIKIVQSLKGLNVPIHGTRGYAKAEVTAGGVDLGEVNFQDMQSRKQPGLFLAGEILDLDGPIGGFNFQAAWSTGHTAGLHL